MQRLTLAGNLLSNVALLSSPIALDLDICGQYPTTLRYKMILRFQDAVRWQRDKPREWSELLTFCCLLSDS